MVDLDNDSMIRYSHGVLESPPKPQQLSLVREAPLGSIKRIILAAAGRFAPHRPDSVRFLCVAGSNHHSGASSTRTSSKNRSYDISKVHQHCTPDSSYVRRDTLDLPLFYASRQVYEDAFVLFWRTTRFCFTDGTPLSDFLIRLTESQEQNPRHLIISIIIAIRGDYVAGVYRWGIEIFVLACNPRRSEFCFLRHLTGLELHLQLSCSQEFQCFDYDAQLDYLQVSFEMVSDLCLLPLKRSDSRIRYAEPVIGCRTFPESRNITKRNLEGIAQKLRKRLLQRTTAKRPFADSLAEKIKKLERSLQDLDRKTRADRHTAASSHKLTIGSQPGPVEGSPNRHESSLKAKAVEERIGRLKAELHKDFHT